MPVRGSQNVCSSTQLTYNNNIRVLLFRFCENNDAFDFADSLLEFHKPGVGLVLLYMSVEGIVFFIITLIIQVCY